MILILNDNILRNERCYISCANRPAWLITRAAARAEPLSAARSFPRGRWNRPRHCEIEKPSSTEAANKPRPRSGHETPSVLGRVALIPRGVQGVWSDLGSRTATLLGYCSEPVRPQSPRGMCGRWSFSHFKLITYRIHHTTAEHIYTLYTNIQLVLRTIYAETSRRL